VGCHDLQRFDRLRSDGERELTALDRCDRLGMPFTFDVVGHTLLPVTPDSLGTLRSLLEGDVVRYLARNDVGRLRTLRS